jgi:peroxiredoxin
MNLSSIAALAFEWLAILAGCWLGWQMLRQNGRLLLRLEELDERVDELEFSEANEPAVAPPDSNDGGERTNRFRTRFLAHSKIKRDGLKAGTPAPDFRLPRLDGPELALEDLRGKRVLLVFSSPHCGPCNMLAPKLEEFHSAHPEVEVVMISNGQPKENRAKVKEHRLTFPVVLQQQWEISRRYAMFATPIAYLLDQAGVIAHDVALGADAILDLLNQAVRAESDPTYHPRAVDKVAQPASAAGSGGVSPPEIGQSRRGRPG